MKTLHGITWDHPRGYSGLLVATETFMRSHPDIRVVWDRHSLHHFEAHPIADLAARYDLIVLDHPFMGDAWRQQCLVDLAPHAASLALEDLAGDCVGVSFESYRYGGLCAFRSTGPARWPPTVATCWERPARRWPRTWPRFAACATAAALRSACGAFIP